VILLDTHVLVWWLNGSNMLSDKAKRLISKSQKEEKNIVVSSISIWEIAMLVDRGRLILSMDVTSWVREAGRIDAIAFVPVDNEIAINSTQLPGEFHKDPADRMIVSLARHLSIPLVTADEKILDYRHVKTVW